MCHAWCQEENKCIKVAYDHGGAEPCGNKCFKGHPRNSYGQNLLCPETNKCNVETVPCGEGCLDNYRWYCPAEERCLYRSQAKFTKITTHAELLLNKSFKSIGCDVKRNAFS